MLDGYNNVRKPTGLHLRPTIQESILAYMNIFIVLTHIRKVQLESILTCRRSPVIKSYLLVLQFAPVYPAAHMHVCELTPSVQEPPFAHGLGWQSSMSRIELTQW